MGQVYTYDDGSQIMREDNGDVLSREIGSQMWQDDATPAPAGWSIFTADNLEQARMGAAYPVNGKAWDENAAMYGVSRVIDSASRAWAVVKGSQPATFAGQNGQTYVNGTRPPLAAGSFTVSPLMMLIGLGAAALLLKKGD